MRSRSLRRRAALAAVAGTAGLLAMGAGPSLAASVGVSHGVLTYTATAGQISNVTFMPDSSTNNAVVLIRNTPSDSDPFTADRSCTDFGTIPGTEYVCYEVTSVSADAGDGDDTLDATALAIPVRFSGQDGSDNLSGGAGNDTLDGGAGDDAAINGGAGDDALSGGAGDDSGMDGGAGNDRLSGGDGGDQISGGGGSDVENGDAGNDYVGGVFSDTGPDVVQGGAGDDTLINFNVTDTNLPSGRPGTPSDSGDIYRGGDGYDMFSASAQNFDWHSSPSPPTVTALNQSVTLDGVANDGASGERDDVLTDVEAASSGTGGADTLVGNAGANDLAGGPGNDTIKGGTGNDVLHGGAGNDALDARDGYADFLSCGDGADVANVDTLDTVSVDCETVNRVNVGNANDVPDVPEDRPPAIALRAPRSGTRLPTRRATAIAATAGDDHGISNVVFMANGRLVCSDTTAPYTCSYRPTGADVGRTALMAIAIDTAQQTATAMRTVRVSRFAPRRLTAKVSPKRDRRKPYRFTTRGRVYLPARVTRGLGCSNGKVSIQVKSGHRTISTRHANLTKRCTYRGSVAFHSKQRFHGHHKLRVTVRFTGNAILSSSKSARRYVRVP